MKTLLIGAAAIVCGALAASGQSIARNPYVGAIVVDASNGSVLFEDGADRPGYPASMLKLMDLFLVFDQAENKMHIHKAILESFLAGRSR